MSTTHISPSARISIGAQVRTCEQPNSRQVRGTVTAVSGDFVTVEFEPATSHLRGATMLASEVIVTS